MTNHRTAHTTSYRSYLSLLLLTVMASLLPIPRLLEARELANQPGVVKQEFIYQEAPFPSCHASTIVETESGLVAAWFGGTHERHPDVGIWVAHLPRGGETWTTPVEVANGVESSELRYPTWNPVLFQVDDSLLLFYKVGPNPREWWGMVMHSRDGGESWSQPTRLPNGILGPIKNKPVELADGTILSPTSSEHAGWRVHFERSIDRGKSWQATLPIHDGEEISAIQPSILLHGNGRLQALGRTKNKRIFETWSADNGKNWGPLTLTKLPNPSAGTDAVTLDDGTHLLIYNHTEQGRSVLNLAHSNDGKNWQAAAILAAEEGGEFSYPAIIQTSDGLVHITYTWHRRRIRHAVIDPSTLATSPIVDGKWPE